MESRLHGVEHQADGGVEPVNSKTGREWRSISRHAWLKYLDLKGVNLGKGKRALFPGGKLDSKYQITLPADLDEHAR